LDLQALWDQHVATEFTERSADAAVATMVPHATVNHVPTCTGGVGTEALRHFYSQHFIPRMPADIHMTPTHRGIGPDFVVDEFNVSFTHSVQMDWMLPGLAPTGKRVCVPVVIVVNFEGDKLASERIYWDQATVLKQLGLLPANLPVYGTEQADKAAAMDALPSNMLIKQD
jgi:carboxymethylenebutenolidase